MVETKYMTMATKICQTKCVPIGKFEQTKRSIILKIIATAKILKDKIKLYPEPNFLTINVLRTRKISKAKIYSLFPFPLSLCMVWKNILQVSIK